MSRSSEFKDLLSRPGIYSIVNSINGKMYIGSTNNMYKEGAFTFKIMCDCEIEDTILFEQTLIDKLKPEYNICKIAGRTSGVPFSDEHRHKLSLAKYGRPGSLGL